MMDRRMALTAVAALAAVGALWRWRRQPARRRRRVVPMPGQERRIVVLGAGFAGLSAATELGRLVGDDESLEILLVDRHNYHLFTPLLYQVATTAIVPDNVAHPIRSLSRRRGFTFQQSEVIGIDLQRRRVLADGAEVPYDYLIAALGSVTNFFGLTQVEEHSLTLKTLGDSIAVRNRILDAFEHADREVDPDRRREWLTFAVVGGGATGVELIAAIHGLVHEVLDEEYPYIAASEMHLLLFEARDQLLLGMSPRLVKIAEERLLGLGVEVRLNTPVQSVYPDRLVTSKNEVVPARTVIWTAGVKANPLWQGMPVEKASLGRVVVNEYLQLPDHPEVYLVGDSSFFRDDRGQSLPPNAPVAIAQGSAAARNVARAIRRQSLQPFHYRSRGDLLALNHRSAVADVLGLQFDGFLGWLVWRLYYLTQLVGFRDRLRTLLDWTFAYFYRYETTELACAREMETEGELVRRRTTQERNRP